MDCHDSPLASLAMTKKINFTHPLNPPPQGRGKCRFCEFLCFFRARFCKFRLIRRICDIFAVFLLDSAIRRISIEVVAIFALAKIKNN
ncbi:hypothetical protein ACWIUD_03505 [Helicobacter sp. 23-1044]